MGGGKKKKNRGLYLGPNLKLMLPLDQHTCKKECRLSLIREDLSFSEPQQTVPALRTVPCMHARGLSAVLPTSERPHFICPVLLHCAQNKEKGLMPTASKYISVQIFSAIVLTSLYTYANLPSGARHPSVAPWPTGKHVLCPHAKTLLDSKTRWPHCNCPC